MSERAEPRLQRVPDGHVYPLSQATGSQPRLSAFVEVGVQRKEVPQTPPSLQGMSSHVPSERHRSPAAQLLGEDVHGGGG